MEKRNFIFKEEELSERLNFFEKWMKFLENSLLGMICELFIEEIKKSPESFGISDWNKDYSDSMMTIYSLVSEGKLINLEVSLYSHIKDDFNKFDLRQSKIKFYGERNAAEQLYKKFILFIYDKKISSRANEMMGLPFQPPVNFSEILEKLA